MPQQASRRLQTILRHLQLDSKSSSLSSCAVAAKEKSDSGAKLASYPVDGSPLPNGLTLYHGHNARSTRVLLLYFELQAARRDAGVPLLPPLKVVWFADWHKFTKTDYPWYLAINSNGIKRK